MEVTRDLHTTDTWFVNMTSCFLYDFPERSRIKILRNVHDYAIWRLVLYLGQDLSPLGGINAGIYLLYPALQVFLSDVGILFQRLSSCFNRYLF